MGKIKESIAVPFKKAGRFVKDKWYDFTVFMHGKVGRPEKKKVISRVKKSNLIFYICLMTIPVIMFAFSQVYINFNSFLLAFQRYENANYVFNGFENFKKVLTDWFTDNNFRIIWRNSAVAYLVSAVVTMIVPILFSYAVYKKCFGWKIFKVILYLPSIISSIITVSIFRFMMEDVVPAIGSLFGADIKGLITDPNKSFPVVLGYSLFVSFGSGLLVQLGAMNAVDVSVTEAGALDGVGFWGELWHIVLPATYQTIFVYFIIGFSTLFTSDMGLFAFYNTGADPRIQTLGYYFTVGNLNKDATMYPYYAAWGLLLSCIAIPITLLLRYLIYNFGPQED